MAAKADWHVEDIKSAIRKTGETMDGLSVRHGYERSSVRKALRRPSPTVEAIIARHLRLQPWDIWPSRYDDRGAPLAGQVRRRGSQSTSEMYALQRKSGAAA